MARIYNRVQAPRRQRISTLTGAILVCVVIAAAGVAYWRLGGHSPKSATAGDEAAATDTRTGVTQNKHEAQTSPPTEPTKPLSREPEPQPEPEQKVEHNDEVLWPRGAEADKPDVQTPPTDDAPAVAMLTENENTQGAGVAPAGNASVEAARKLIAAGQLLDARARLNTLLKQDLSPADQNEVRTLLAKLADQTIFSRQIIDDDPLVATYVVQSGDNPTNIAAEYQVPPEIVMEINGIQDARKMRVGQKLKLPRGPFNVKIDKSDFRMDIYLGELYVRSYRVGLGADQGTPEGVWKVKNRLANPTYYPPASATNKRIIAADDPENPLGEHWIGLEGVEGEAVGHEGFGIHGTIAPESIGKAVSMGCIRMHNQDVAIVYTLLKPNRSTVTILP
ncbi:MAG: L,D-transpeptidase family protein [Phycisphaerae bacterium]|nr:L,D-transpeptidase family protein [Phycisphaerae bacterium]